MSAPLFLVDELPAGGGFRLGGAEGRHAADVQRLRPGEELLLSDGRGGVANAVVTAAGKGALEVEVRRVEVEPAPTPRLVVVQGLPKGERAELAVQAMTEVGVDVIIPWAAQRSVVQWKGTRGEKSLEKWRATAREAAKQARRAWVPVIEPAATTQEVCRRLGRGLILHEEAGSALGGVHPHERVTEGGDLVVVVGPEGGIAPAELAAFEAAGALPVRLGPTVLRTSTAGVAALSVLQARLHRW